MSETSEDGFLGGRVKVRQPLRGFRAGLDAVMLSAAVPAKRGEEALELGAGVGTASLCLAFRVENLTVAGLEIDQNLVALANANARLRLIQSFIVLLLYCFFMAAMAASSSGRV